MYERIQLKSDIECGMVMSGHSRDMAIDNCRKIEAAGFDSLWVGDHVSFYIPIMESLTMLSFVAAATDKIKLGTSVYLLPLAAGNYRQGDLDAGYIVRWSAGARHWRWR